MYWKLLKNNRGYRTLLARELISSFGSSFVNVAITGMLLSFYSSPLSVGIFKASQSLFLFIISLFSGTLIDLYSNVKLVIIADLLALCLDIGLIITHQFHLFWLFVVVNIGLVMTKSISHPAADSFFPQVIPSDLIPSANVLTETLEGFISLLAIAIGGIITTYLGTFWTFVLDGTTYIIAVLLFSTFIWGKRYYQFIATEIEAKKINLHQSKLDITKDFCRYFFSSDSGWFALTWAWIEISDHSLKVSNVIWSEKFFTSISEHTILKISLPLAICYFVASLAGILGPLIGNLIINSSYYHSFAEHKIHNILLIGMNGVLIGTLMMTITPNLGHEITWLIGVFLFEFGGSILEVFIKSYLQTKTLPIYRGRIFTASLALRTGFGVVGSLLTGYLWSQYPNYMAIYFGVLATSNLLLALFWIFYTRSLATKYQILPYTSINQGHNIVRDDLNGIF